MILIRFEKWMMRCALRRWGQRRVEAPRVFRGVDVPEGATVLEIGCGYGDGVLLIAQRFAGARVVAMDLDEEIVAAAQQRIALPPRWARAVATDRITLLCGDATALSFPDAAFDAVILFGMLHHVREWRRVIAEAHRVLRPGGVFAFEEALIGNRWWRFNDRWGHVPFKAAELREALGVAGFQVERFDDPWYLPLCFVQAVRAF
ncbi:MAG TPA: class I SAM-dependent methyltransferase [Phycisphaerae bacterium]|nr:class I SAM-dependent methyltransferase [Phycisphaerae bacterium]